MAGATSFSFEAFDTLGYLTACALEPTGIKSPTLLLRTNQQKKPGKLKVLPLA